MCDRITYCDVCECAECPKYGDDCDGEKRNDDLISRADAIEAVCGVVIDEFDVSPTRGYEVSEKALSALPSAENSNAKTQNSNQETQNSNGDLIYRADAIKAVAKEVYHSQTDRKTVISVLSALPSAEAEKHRIYKDGYNTGKAHASAEASQNLAKPNKELKGSDVISRDVVLANIDERLRANGYGNVGLVSELNRLVGYVRNIPSAEAVQGWRTGKPTENGEYMVTLDAWGHRYINIMHYAKPQMPNRNVDGMCWYRSDDEWGDVVYDDNDILAWMPLPKPYKGGDTE